MTDSTIRGNTWNNIARWTLLALLFAAFALRVYVLTTQDIWWDEARNIDVSLRRFSQVAVAPELDIHPPLYFWVLHIWSRVAGVTLDLDAAQIAYLMRFVSVSAGIIGVALLFAFTRLIAGIPAALISTAIGTFSPFWLAESQETRMYTLGFALLLGAAICLMYYISRTRDSVGWWKALTGFVILSALALLTHYNAVFILVAWYMWWGLYALSRGSGRRIPELVRVFVAGLTMTVLVSPITPIALRQIPGYSNPNLTVPTIGEYLWQNWSAYIGGYAYSADMLWSKANGWLLGSLVIGIIGVALYTYSLLKQKSNRKLSEFTFVLFWLAGGLALYYVAVLDRGAFNVRYSSFVTPALYALLGIAIVAWRRVHWTLAVVAALVVFIGFAPAIRADLIDDRFAREDISAVTDWLRKQAGPNDIVLVDQKYPFGFYYDNYAIAPDEQPTGTEAASARYLFVDINTIDERLNELASDAESVYWVQWYESDTDPRRAVSFLLDKKGQRAGEEWFRGYSIDWWNLDPPSQFELAPQMQSLKAQFGQAVRTVEVSIGRNEFRPGDGVPIVIRWEQVPDGIADRPLKARVALYDENDARLAQVDKRILNDRHLHAAEWRTEDQPLNVYLVDLPEDILPGEYSLRLLVYDEDTLEPLLYFDAAGNQTGLEADLGQIHIEEN